jgi:hypothetical protein
MGDAVRSMLLPAVPRIEGVRRLGVFIGLPPAQETK